MRARACFWYCARIERTGRGLRAVEFITNLDLGLALDIRPSEGERLRTRAVLYSPQNADQYRCSRQSSTVRRLAFFQSAWPSKNMRLDPSPCRAAATRRSPLRTRPPER